MTTTLGNGGAVEEVLAQSALELSMTVLSVVVDVDVHSSWWWPRNGERVGRKIELLVRGGPPKVLHHRRSSIVALETARVVV